MTICQKILWNRNISVRMTTGRTLIWPISNFGHGTQFHAVGIPVVEAENKTPKPIVSLRHISVLSPVISERQM